MPRPLQDEIKQTKPFATLEQEAILNIERTAALLGHQLEQALKPHGITPTQYNVLRILRGAGERGLCRNEIRDRLISQVPDVTRLLDRLEDLKLIERERDAADRRLVNTHITSGGLELLDRLDEPVIEFHRGQLGHLGTENLRMLIDLLSRAREPV
jgi:DNA-binding MarR family transcriptional regulator